MPLVIVAANATTTHNQIAGAGVEWLRLTRFQIADPGIPESRANA